MRIRPVLRSKLTPGAGSPGRDVCGRAVRAVHRLEDGIRAMGRVEALLQVRRVTGESVAGFMTGDTLSAIRAHFQKKGIRGRVGWSGDIYIGERTVIVAKDLKLRNERADGIAEGEPVPPITSKATVEAIRNSLMVSLRLVPSRFARSFDLVIAGWVGTGIGSLSSLDSSFSAGAGELSPVGEDRAMLEAWNVGERVVY